MARGGAGVAHAVPATRYGGNRGDVAQAVDGSGVLIAANNAGQALDVTIRRSRRKTQDRCREEPTASLRGPLRISGGLPRQGHQGSITSPILPI
jgi:hypothetical protein